MENGDKFKNGDRVRVIGDYDSARTGQTATVVSGKGEGAAMYGAYTVRYDTKTEFTHDADGTDPDERSYYIDEKCLELETIPIGKVNIKFNF